MHDNHDLDEELADLLFDFWLWLGWPVWTLLVVLALLLWHYFG